MEILVGHTFVKTSRFPTIRIVFLSITKVISIIICQKYPHCFQQRDETPNLYIQRVKELYSRIIHSFVHFKREL